MDNYRLVEVANDGGQTVIPSRTRRPGISQLQEAHAPECMREPAVERSFIVCAIQDDSFAP
jgi:hypothetical protein